MRIVKVTYTVREEYAPVNSANIKAVMSALRDINDPGINYHVCLSPDNKSFTHTAFFNSEDKEQVLFNLASFKSFREQLKASNPETPPQNEVLTLVGSSKELFN
jgi:hypothetical protein